MSPTAANLEATYGFLVEFASRLDEREKVALGQLLPRSSIAQLYELHGLDLAPYAVDEHFKRRAKDIAASIAVNSTPATLRDQVYMIMKSTRICNLRCAYCNAWRTGPNQKMSFDTLAQATIGILSNPTVRQVDFVWHGGEATLLPLTFYKAALWLQKQFNKSGATVRNSLQTNGVQLSDEWIEFLAVQRFGVGISIDGPPQIHDKVRKDIRGRPTAQRVSATVEKMKSAGIPFGFLMVVTPEIVDLGAATLLEWLSSTGVSNLSVLNSIPDNSSTAHCPEHFLAFDEYVKFLVNLFEIWSSRYKGEIVIRELDSLLNNLNGSSPVLCVHKGRCMGQFLTVDPDGAVSACDKYIKDDSYRFGSLATASLDSIVTQSKALKDAALNSDLQSEAYERACEFGHVCNGGCPHDAYLLKKFGIKSSSTCCGLAPLIRKMGASFSSARSF